MKGDAASSPSLAPNIAAISERASMIVAPDVGPQHEGDAVQREARFMDGGQ
jgi:hypothetical protein